MKSRITSLDRLLASMGTIGSLALSMGTFNPIHNMHLDVAQCAIEQEDEDAVLFIPNFQPVHKSGVLGAKYRWEMVQAGCRTNPLRFKPCDIEIKRGGPSYTVDTLWSIRKAVGSDIRLDLILGFDNIDGPHPIAAWERAEDILCSRKLDVRLLIAPRVTQANRGLESVSDFLPPGVNWKPLKGVVATDVSSTTVRQRVANGRSIQYLVPPAVAHLIEKRGHYLPQSACTVPLL